MLLESELFIALHCKYVSLPASFLIMYHFYLHYTLITYNLFFPQSFHICNVNLIFYTFVSISAIYHILQDSSVGSLVTVSTSEATYPFHTAAILLFHFYDRSSTFSSSEYILITLTSLLGIATKGASVDASLCLYTCHITDFTKLNIRSLGKLQRHEIRTEFK